MMPPISTSDTSIWAPPVTNRVHRPKWSTANMDVSVAPTSAACLTTHLITEAETYAEQDASKDHHDGKVHG